MLSCKNIVKSIVVWLLFLTPTTGISANTIDLADLSLEDLMGIEVSLVSRKQERLFKSPAAVYVLTQEDIARSGATSIPEALRLIPGMVVGRVDANKWAVSTRGFNGRFAQELLVLIDGRTVYTPLFSGVFWEMRDVLLENISKIEVIRGPGGTLWGANAVNGIINIVTEKAEKKNFIKAGIGTEERGFGAINLGQQLSTNTFGRFYIKSFMKDAFVDQTGQAGVDDWHMHRGGFRLDHQPSRQTTMTLQGDVFGGTRGQVYRFPTLMAPYMQFVESDTRLTGGNLVGRYTKIFSSKNEVSLQAYYDQTSWQDTLFVEKRKTYDIDFQHRLQWQTKHETVYGFGYRLSTDNIQGSTWTTINQPKRNLSLYSAFLQHTLTIVPNQFTLTAGTKIEHNDHTGFEYQPSIRAMFAPTTKHTFWTAATRAIRTPSRTEDDLQSTWFTLPPDSVFAGSPPVEIVLAGDRSIESSVLLAFELGYRFHPTNRFFVDLATFYNDYDGLRAGKPGAPSFQTDPIFHLKVPALAANNVWGETYGYELTTDWQPNATVRLRAAYSYIKMDLTTFPDDSDDAIPGTYELLTSENRSNPKHQAFFWTSLTPHPNWTLDGILRYVSALSALNTPAYLECDLRTSIRPVPQLEIALVGRNLLHNHHREYEATLVNTTPTETQRSVYTTFTWSF